MRADATEEVAQVSEGIEAESLGSRDEVAPRPMESCPRQGGRKGRWITPMARSRRPSGWTWVYDPPGAFRRSKKPVAAHLQQEVERRAQELIDLTLKPRYIQPPPNKTEFNYLVDFRGTVLLVISCGTAMAPMERSSVRLPSGWTSTKFSLHRSLLGRTLMSNA